MGIKEIINNPRWKLANINFTMNNGEDNAEEFNLQDETNIKLDGNNLKITYTRMITPDSDNGFSLSVSFEAYWEVTNLDELKKHLEDKLNIEETSYLVGGSPSEASLIISQIMRAGELPLLIVPPILLKDNKTNIE